MDKPFIRSFMVANQLDHVGTLVSYMMWKEMQSDGTCLIRATQIGTTKSKPKLKLSRGTWQYYVHEGISRCWAEFRDPFETHSYCTVIAERTYAQH